MNPTIPTVDAFHALARSSPRRWTTLHFRHRATLVEDGVEAWLRRPGRLLVRTPDGQERRVVEQVGSSRAIGFAVDVDAGLDPDAVPGVQPVPPPAYGSAYGDDDPMWVNYRWVAALNPVELSHHVAVDRLRVDEVAGRPVWRADLRALPGYDPRCGGNCCELLWSEVGRVCEVSDPADAYHPPGEDYPDHYDVALDVATGVVVRCLPVGGDPASPWLENDILEVDADLPGVTG
ncbi:MAG: hypothetical protein HYU55_16520 [Nocardioides sp.]|nr:hypothetical protein [Nocardioides sp.]